MTQHPRRTPRVLSDEEAAERFDTVGKTFAESLRLVLAGGPDDGHGGAPTDEPEADEHG